MTRWTWALGALLGMSLAPAVLAQQTYPAQTQQRVRLSDAQLKAMKDQYHSLLAREIDSANARIVDLEKADLAAKGATKHRYDSLLKDADAKRDALNGDVKAIDGATRDNWIQVRRQADKDATAMRNVIRRVAIAMRPAKPRKTNPR